MVVRRRGDQGYRVVACPIFFHLCKLPEDRAEDRVDACDMSWNQIFFLNSTSTVTFPRNGVSGCWATPPPPAQKEASSHNLRLLPLRSAGSSGPGTWRCALPQRRHRQGPPVGAPRRRGPRCRGPIRPNHFYLLLYLLIFTIWDWNLIWYQSAVIRVLCCDTDKNFMSGVHKFCVYSVSRFVLRSQYQGLFKFYRKLSIPYFQTQPR